MRHLILCSVMWLCGLMMAVGQNVPQSDSCLAVVEIGKRKNWYFRKLESDCFFRMKK